jgi:hypothetical protein
MRQAILKKKSIVFSMTLLCLHCFLEKEGKRERKIRALCEHVGRLIQSTRCIIRIYHNHVIIVN